MAKKIDELERPKIPGYIDMSKVNSAAGNIAAARDAINNLNYDTFKQGTQYGNLKKSYEQQGQAAMKDTLGQVAARTGGMASSYATSAANQSYNNYMQTLEDAARSMFNEEYARKKDAYNMAQQEYANAYGEYRDAKSDAWTEYDVQNRNFENDREFNRQLERDQKSDKDAAEAQAQDDILAIWEAGGTPSLELLQAAGWYDEATGGVNATGAAYKYGIDENLSAGKETEAQQLVTDMWAAGIDPTDEQLVAAGYKTKTEGKDANGNPVYNWTDEGLAAMYSATGLSDTELEQLFGAEGFDWDTYDFDKDGNVGSDDTDGEDMSGFFANSSFGEDYWKKFYQDSLNTKTENDTKESQSAAVSDIEARIANGESLEDIADEYDIDGTNVTWDDVTGMSEAQWQKFANDNKVGNYHFADTSAGRSEIVNKMLGSGSLKLGSGDQANFDYLYGDGAYDAVQTFIETISPNNMGSERFGDSDFHQYTLSAFENEFNRIVDELYEIAPGLDYTTQVLEIVKKANPEMYEAATNLSKYKFAD